MNSLFCTRRKIINWQNIRLGFTAHNIIDRNLWCSSKLRPRVVRTTCGVPDATTLSYVFLPAADEGLWTNQRDTHLCVYDWPQETDNCKPGYHVWLQESHTFNNLLNEILKCNPDKTQILGAVCQGYTKFPPNAGTLDIVYRKKAD